MFVGCRAQALRYFHCFVDSVTGRLAPFRYKVRPNSRRLAFVSSVSIRSTSGQAWDRVNPWLTRFEVAHFHRREATKAISLGRQPKEMPCYRGERREAAAAFTRVNCCRRFAAEGLAGYSIPMLTHGLCAVATTWLRKRNFRTYASRYRLPCSAKSKRRLALHSTGAHATDQRLIIFSVLPIKMPHSS